jgi:hypothetical protein
MLTYNGILCCYPRWIAPDFWIGNQAIIESAKLPISKIQKNGWNRQELIELKKRIGNDKYVLVGDLGAQGFFPQLINNANPGLDNINYKQDINSTIDLIDILVHQKAIPADCHHNMLRRFLRGQVMLLAGLRPLILNYIIDRNRINNVNWRPVLLPIPGLKQRSIAVENGVIAIYRNRRTAGDDHLTAAMKFGRFLSYYQNTAPWEYLMVVPAAKSVYSKWILNIPQNSEIFNQLTDIMLVNKKIFNSNFPDRIYPILDDFIAKKITAAEVKSKMNNL